ncbi:MAG: aspartate-semialdehyde dehydrogenase [Christensenellaceae bacterium]|jgi:aspartate-semialdehyde dehydrogenase|nr:aspartate-semialdehyde dehydrogenase [Christensenellaceae bacterium]
MRIAVVGATGLVGRKILEVLGRRAGQKLKLFLFASPEEKGTPIEFRGHTYKTEVLSVARIKKIRVDFALFSAGAEVSRVWAPIFAESGATVIDNSTAFRNDPEIPLVVPEINFDAIKPTDKIIANPNCSTIIAVLALSEVRRLFGLKRVLYSSYQAVSGMGTAALDDFWNGVNRAVKFRANGIKERGAPKVFKYEIFNNLIPQIDSFTANGNTKEEEKMINETRKILNDANLKVTATCVRVPIENGHSVSINAECEREIDIGRLREALAKTKGVVLLDSPEDFLFPMPIFANGRDEVFVGRLRLDNSAPNALNFFVCGDNILKGAALNAVQIMERLATYK